MDCRFCDGDCPCHTDTTTDTRCLRCDRVTWRVRFPAATPTGAVLCGSETSNWAEFYERREAALRGFGAVRRKKEA